MTFAAHARAAAASMSNRTGLNANTDIKRKLAFYREKAKGRFMAAKGMFAAGAD